MLDVHDVVVVVVIVVAGIAVALHVDGIVFFVLLLKDVHLPMSAKRNDHPKMHPNFHLHVLAIVRKNTISDYR